MRAAILAVAFLGLVGSALAQVHQIISRPPLNATTGATPCTAGTNLVFDFSNACYFVVKPDIGVP